MKIELIELASGKQVVVVEIPESPGAPHMMTYRGRSEFWRRHGRQKSAMTVDEIRDTVLRTLDNQGRIDRFMAQRDVEMAAQFNGRCYLVLSAIPSVFDNLTRFNLRHPDLPRAIFQMQLSLNNLLPTIDGIRATDSLQADEARGPVRGDYLECYRNGYIELGTHIENDRPFGGLYYASTADSRYVVTFTDFIGRVADVIGDVGSMIVRMKVFNARGLRLAARSREMIELVKPIGPAGHLDVGSVVVPDRATLPLVPRWLCDRLWNAYGFEASNAFDGQGQLRKS